MRLVSESAKARRTAIHFAREAYDLWRYNSIMKTGFQSIPLDHIRYTFEHGGYVVALGSGGALRWACPKDEAEYKEWR